MRLVGYVRESPGPVDAETPYAQNERIRRYAAEGGHQLIAMCQDVRQPGVSLGRDGYLAMLGIINTDQVDAAAIGSVASLSSDIITQEILIWDLRSRGVSVISTDPEDVPILADPPADASRRLIRDVLARVRDHLSTLEPPGPPPLAMEEPPALGEGEVLIELVPADDEEQRGSGA